ncbi:hypothetical protein [Sharpea porci]|uniref:hypothetical protein n=1 Tax=Sharpea porci TaxID=2652286 RepID=UPI002A91E860|nr:hypothetical protein [Sharpea porci]MDY5279461.1 hypothetical protein [Sharpea porci]
MSYTVYSSERLRKTAADAETKALLYLMNFRDDSPEMNFFIVDFFNDVTGMDRMGKKLWDVQSKATKNASAKEIGRELVTLFKNFLSEFTFVDYVIFMGGVPGTFRKDSSKNLFDVTNINEKAFSSVREGLMEESKAKEYIDNSFITDKNIDEFLKLVWFVVDDKLPQDYIKKIIKDYPSIIPSDSILIAIFNEIRNKQSELKNTIVEGVTIDKISDVLKYGRELNSHEIRLLVLQRILNTDPLSKGIPEPFMEVYSHYPVERRKMLLEQCQSAMCRALFNNSLKQAYWALIDNVYTSIIHNPGKNIDDIVDLIPDDVLNACIDFDAISLKYFVAKIMEGISQ